MQQKSPYTAVSPRAARTDPTQPPSTRGIDTGTLEPLWTHQQTAEFLGIPAATLYQLNHKRTGPRSYKVGKHRRYAQHDVLAWLETRACDYDEHRSATAAPLRSSPRRRGATRA